MPLQLNPFSPNVRTLRLHGFSIRPCFDLLDPDRRTPLTKSFLSEDLYYGTGKLDYDPNGNCRFEPLGRRFQHPRSVASNKELRPHGFWGKYMGFVAGPEYRGSWRGLAPMRIAFKDTNLIRISPDIPGLANPLLRSIRVYPSCYFFPIGWSVGVVIQLEGELPFEQSLELITFLRNEPAFTVGGRGPLTLSNVLAEMHKKISADLILPAKKPVQEQEPNPYIVVSPIRFEGQPSFGGHLQIDLDRVSEMLSGRKMLTQQGVVITPDTLSLAVTVFGKGSLVFAARPDRDRNVPGCAASNLKNALLATMMMEKFHRKAFNHRSSIVQAMRPEVAETFRQLYNFWLKPHFQAVCAADTGLKAILNAPAPSVAFTFIGSVLNNVAVGTTAQVAIASGSPSQQAPLTQNQKGAAVMSTFTFNNNTMTNTAVGDHATININGQQMSLNQLATKLTEVGDKARTNATNDEQRADADKIETAVTEANKGNESGVKSTLKTMGVWGWEICKEVLKDVTTEGIKAWMTA